MSFMKVFKVHIQNVAVFKGEVGGGYQTAFYQCLDKI